MNAPGSINEQIRQRFELSWQRGAPAAIADILPEKEDPGYLVTLEELVHIDIEFRGARQQEDAKSDLTLQSIRDYVAQFPELADPNIIRRLIQQDIHVRRACRLAEIQEAYARDFGNVVADVNDIDKLLADSQAGFRSTALRAPDTHEARTLMPSDSDAIRMAMTILPGIDPVTSLGSIPEQIGNYRLIRQLGAGGMGCVYEAEEIGTGQRVAVKIILPELVTSQEAMDRFRQEGQLASTIAHPNCVFVLEADQDGKYPYIVMELVKGTDLDDFVRNHGKLGIQDAVRKILDIIEGLEEAHRLGVIHRDVKPSNCFLTADGKVKIGDFGLSRTLAEDIQLTQAGSFIGTPLYASPEQIRNDKLDGRTDVYSVASTLYFLLTGQAPFHGENAVSAMARIVADPAPPIRELRPEVHKSIADVIHRGLATDRDKRYKSMTDFRNALTQFLPVERSPASELLRLGAWWIDTFPITTCTGLLYSFVVALSSPDANTLYISGALTPDFHANISFFLQVTILFAYFVYFESRFGCTLGKKLLRFRVRAVDGGALQIKTVTLRTCILFLFFYGPSILIILTTAFFRPAVTVILTMFVGWISLIPLLTMRQKNGYRCLHDIWSGAVVVKLPSAKARRKRVVATVDIATALPTMPAARNVAMPTQLGPYRIQKPLRWTDGESVLDAHDDRLNRNVWVHLRHPGAPVTTPARHDIDRQARLRWLGSAEQEEGIWDAYLAPEGMPLAQYIANKGTIDWLTTRELVESLANELIQSDSEGHSHAHLSPHHLWVRADGGITLMDFALGQDETIVTEPSKTNEQNGLALLLATAIYCIEGVCPTSDEIARRDSVAAVVTGHVSGRFRKVLANCLLIHEKKRNVDGPRAVTTSIVQFQQDLQASKNDRFDKPKVGVSKRFATTLFQAIFVFWPFALGMLRIFEDQSAPFGKGLHWNLIQDFGVFMLFPVLLTVYTYSVRGGYSFAGNGIEIAKKDGGRASRLRIAWRGFLIWVPVIVVLTIGVRLEDGPVFYFLRNNMTLVLVAIGAVYFIQTLISPRRGLHDVIAGTTLIPR
ncbi:MAG: protein kinase [Planctomycetota bacterium]|nr:protein kinase [Planctomycetota bacterium]